MRKVKGLQNACIPPNQLNLIFQSRIIWRDLATWLRAYIASKDGGLGDVEAIWEKINELLLKSSSIFSLAFGEQVAEQYLSLLINYINTLDSLIDAQVNEDTNAESEYTKQLYKNSDEMAAFLADLNPFWIEDKWKNLFYQFNQRTIEQSATFLNKDFKRNVDIFDSILNLTSVIGDYFSRGILDYLTFSG